MTDKEALDWFKDSLKDGKCSAECPQCNAMERAVEALEKQIPKKPTKSKREIAYAEVWKCPACGFEFSGRVAAYCYRCGQKIDWSAANDG